MQGEQPQTDHNNDLRGALFQNDKGDNPARPGYRGRCVIAGREYRISGWKRLARSNNKPFISLSFTDNGPIGTADGTDEQGGTTQQQIDNIPF